MSCNLQAWHSSLSLSKTLKNANQKGMVMVIVRCISCEGYGWIEDEFSYESGECEWCNGVGYVYRSAEGVDNPIPESDWGKVEAELERLEQERLSALGYSGTAKKPWEQDIREGTQGGANPYEGNDGE
jgi:hypothetical protein